MGKDTPSAPTPVNPAAVINAASDASRVNQNGPGGSTTWQKQNGQWTQNTSLSPNQAGLLNQSQHAASGGVLDLKNANKSLQTGLDLSGVQGIPQANNGAYNKAVDSVYNQAASRLNPQWNQQQTELQTQLANEGIPQNSDAWNKAMTQFGQQKNDAYTSAENNAVTQGSQVENSLFNMGLEANQAGVGNALSSANLNNSATGQRTSTDLATSALPGQYLSTSLPGTGQAPDALGAYSLAAQQQMAQYQSQLGANSAKKGGTGSLLGTLGGAAILSDRRIKRDINVIGKAPNGLPIYSFRYAWDDKGKRQIGLMAQDVEKTNPAAVVTIGGVKHVDYGKALAA